ncbi:MAG TPA: hypothetical protein VJR89_29910, partial [Polyangiales bacterium]|nr:hypothetical protein [Polyangiales bacterium]
RSMLVRARNETKRERTLRSVGLAAAVAVGCGVAAFATSELLRREVTGRELTKLELIGRSFGFAWDHFWTGVGRGAFASSFAAVEGTSVRYAYAENFLAQWLADWGWPLTFAWLAAVAVALVRSKHGLKSLTRRGAMIAFLALCAQNLVDLGFEVLGVAVVAAALFATIVTPAKPATTAAASGTDLRSALALGGVCCAAVLLAFGPRLDENSVGSLHSRLLDQMSEPDQRPFQQTLARALQLHPSEPTLTILGASAALQHGDPATARWINRVMQLAPRWAAPHILAHRWLWSLGHTDQSLLELKLAAAIDPRPVQDHICEVARRPDALVLRAAPSSGPQRLAFLEMAAECLPIEHPSAAAIDRTLMKEFPDRGLAYVREAARLSAAGKVHEGLALVERMLKRMPAEKRLLISRAHILLQSNRYQDALAYIEHDLPLLNDEQKRELLPLQATAFARLKDAAAVARVIAEYRRLGAGSAEALAESHALEGRMSQVMDQPGSALSAYREAYSINPNTRYLAEIASLAERLGDRAQRAWAYNTLCEREPGTEYCTPRSPLLRSQSAELH